MRKLVTTALVIVALACTGTVLADGALTIAPTARTYAREYGFAGVIYTLPAGAVITKTTGITRSYNQNFYVDYELLNDATWSGISSATPPAAGMFAATATGCTYSADFIVVSGKTLTVEFSAGPVGCIATSTITTTFTPGSTAKVDDVSGRIGAGEIGLKAQLRDATTNVVIDNGFTTMTGGVLKSAFAIAGGTLIPTSATIDILATGGLARMIFVEAGANTTVINKGATLPTTNDNTLLNSAGTATGYVPVSTDCVRVTIAGTSSAGGDFTGVKKLYYGATPTSYTVTDADRTANSATFAVAADVAGLIGSAEIWVEVDGATVLTPRSFTVKAELRTTNGGGCSATTHITNPFFATATLFTTWHYNGTQLIAPWANGNVNWFRSRFYLSAIGSTTDAAVVLFRLLESKVAGTTTALTDYLVLPTTVNTTGSRIVKLEDLLTQAGLPVPFLGVEGNGNIAVEFLVGASPAQGTASIYNYVIVNGPVAVGSYALQNGND